MLKDSDYLMTYGVLVLSIPLRILLGDFGHNGIRNDIASASNEFELRSIEKVGQGVYL